MQLQEREREKEGEGYPNAAEITRKKDWLG